MLKIVIAVLVLIEVKQCRVVNKRETGIDIQDLLKQLQDLKSQIDTLDKNSRTTTKVTTPKPQLAMIDDQRFQQRLVSLEGTIEAIKKYLIVEKKKDIALKLKSEKIVDEMKSKVGETKVIIQGLKDDVKASLQDFEHTIKEVNTSAHMSVNVEGVVYYGGMGSACSDSGNECKLPGTECREEKCQCLAGLSYDWKEKTCTKSCISYGKTYQSFDRRIIRGFNSLTLEEVSGIKECKERCDTETTFVCKTIDYFPRWKECYLSDKTKSDADVPEEAWEYNSVGKHFQRDCV